MPAVWAGQTLLVKETEDRRLVVCDAAGDVVAEHCLLEGNHQWSVNPAHYAGLPAAVSRPPRDHLAFQEGSGRTPPEVEQRPLSVYAQLAEVRHD